jgi:hypothetical protein
MATTRRRLADATPGSGTTLSPCGATDKGDEAFCEGGSGGEGVWNLWYRVHYAILKRHFLHVSSEKNMEHAAGYLWILPTWLRA